MKKIKSLNKIILMLAVVAMICAASVVSNASQTGNVDELFNIPVVNNGASTQTPVENVPTQNIPANNTVNTSLPKTGINDTIMWVAIAGCVILALYTYKKVRDYNV